VTLPQPGQGSSSPLQHYRVLTGAGQFIPDPEQEFAVKALDDLWQQLTHPAQQSFWDRIRRHPAMPIPGLYLWGGVGRGKTWLMDLFYELLPFEDKQRIHFHRFMERIHQQLNSLGDTRDPLPLLADEWARQCRVLCLDEFFVSDIADAMLLAGLLEALFARGVTLVTTSNTAPDNLYRDGLQRSKFVPAIDMIIANTRVLELAGNVDFRLRILEQSEIYLHPLSSEAEAALNSSFEQMAGGCMLENTLEINGRPFIPLRRGDGVIWFDFEELCIKPRGGSDYIEIARRFNTVLISNIPQLTEEDSDATRRFVTMIDEFYDRNVKILLSAACPLNMLYSGRRLEFEFQRTESRLTEMQSHDYLAQPHLP
jgi:cell division protein ZapE